MTKSQPTVVATNSLVSTALRSPHSHGTQRDATQGSNLADTLDDHFFFPL